MAKTLSTATDKKLAKVTKALGMEIKHYFNHTPFTAGCEISTPNGQNLGMFRIVKKKNGAFKVEVKLEPLVSQAVEKAGFNLTHDDDIPVGVLVEGPTIYVGDQPPMKARAKPTRKIMWIETLAKK
jgi:hypothetical protein